MEPLISFGLRHQTILFSIVGLVLGIEVTWLASTDRLLSRFGRLKMLFVGSVLGIAIGSVVGQLEPLPNTLALQFPDPICHSGSRKLILFIHGWNGDPQNTWRKYPQLICEDPDFADTEVLSLGYPTFVVQRNLLIEDTASWINERLIPHGISHYQRIVFVTHSIGGLIAREMLMQMNLAGRPELKRIGMILEFGTPHLGAANYAQLATALGLPGSDIIEEVKPESGFLHSLEANWNQFELRPRSYCYTSPQDWLVSETSALFQCDPPNHKFPDVDHRDLVKPDTRNDDRYSIPMDSVKHFMLAQP